MNSPARGFTMIAMLASVAFLARVCAAAPQEAGDERKDDPSTMKNATPAQLCNENGRVRYTASQIPGAVLIVADGEHPRLGYEVFFEQSPLKIYPPQFLLKHRAPVGMAGTQIKPFHVTTQFEAGKRIDSVIVHDAKGPHTVRVDQARD